MTILQALSQYLDVPDVSDQTIKAVAKISQVRSYESDEIVYREDEPSAFLSIVLSGQIDVQYLLESGKRQTVDSLKAGDFMVWSAIVKPYTTSSIGICRARSEVVAIEAVGLRAICEEDPLFGYRLTSQISRVISRRLRAARRQIADMD